MKGFRNKRARKRVFYITLIGLAIGIVVGGITGSDQNNPHFIFYYIVKGATNASLISFATAWFEFIGSKKLLRPFNFLTVFILKSLVQGFIVVGLFILTSLAFAPLIGMDLQMGMLFPVSVISFVSISIGMFTISTNRLIGRGVLWKFMSGRYHKPLEENRIFMFLDLVSSTTIAEKTGHVKFHAFLNEFFYDISEPIDYYKGEIYKYVGDEVIVVWKVGLKNENRRAVDCLFGILDTIRDRREHYLESYGYVPEFRTGIHCGKVISGEIGDDKCEIAYLGDVVNTAARIQGEAKQLEKDLLVSNEFLRLVDISDDYSTSEIGAVQLKGKDKQVVLFEVKR